MFRFLKNNFRNVLIALLMPISFFGVIKFKMMGELSRKEIHDNLFSISLLIFILSLGYFIILWLFNLWKQYKQLKNKKTEVELALLKSKIDPHFFFNTLNNLYGLAIEKSDQTPNVILELSEIMRYTIYEGDNKTVSIKDEISYLEKYIEIHKIRYKKKVDIQFETAIDSLEKQIPPLLFIMLLENAFKHGVESLTDDAYIHMRLSIKNSSLLFTIENNYRKIKKKNIGVGLNNLKRRLQLLFPKKHELQIIVKPSVFKVQLTIKLS